MLAAALFGAAVAAQQPAWPNECPAAETPSAPPVPTALPSGCPAGPAGTNFTVLGGCIGTTSQQRTGNNCGTPLEANNSCALGRTGCFTAALAACKGDPRCFSFSMIAKPVHQWCGICESACNASGVHYWQTFALGGAHGVGSNDWVSWALPGGPPAPPAPAPPLVSSYNQTRCPATAT